ncbi:hypothetical protein [Pyrobaculum aerophilum]|uniref:Uncharacterized protein n=2 Tax=Pyrobaculum aerophilum TaxID=13773 RepID=Q8ZV71_PYRAE|nr:MULTISPECIES: hypothetical protein [Pyrobaculum]AAL64185.1 hypothetical protein PAE2424 [Pyrobaculum aerophilum str. IM2]MCX8135762.1 hypothetical protein [Pyrobaculum aerophilum]HII47054.1 hypothetical protein [Pyrobaculum aerophilum]
MKLAYARGPPIAVFAGSWKCTVSPIDGTPIALGEPFGDCEPDIDRLISIATTVRIIKQMGVKVFISRELGEDEVDAAYAGGADGVLEELSFSRDEYRDGVQFVLFQPADPVELVNRVREIAQRHKKPFDVLVATSFENAKVFAPYVDGVVLTGGWVGVELTRIDHLPEVGRCVHCGMDFLMYGNSLKRCVYCGRRLIKVITSTRPPRSKAVFRSVFKQYVNVNRLRFKVV